MAIDRPVAAGVILASLKNFREQISHFSHVVFTMKAVVVNRSRFVVVTWTVRERHHHGLGELSRSFLNKLSTTFLYVIRKASK